MRAATHLAWIFAVGAAALGGCAQLGASLDFARLEKRPARTTTAEPLPPPPSTANRPPAPGVAALPQRLPPPEATASPPANEVRQASWGGLLDLLAPARSSQPIPEEATPPPPSEFTTTADVQISPAAVPTKEELLATLRARPDIDPAELDRWQRIVQSTPDDDWPLVALQLQAVLNYKSFQAAQRQETERQNRESGGRDQESGVRGQEAGDGERFAADLAPPDGAPSAPSQPPAAAQQPPAAAAQQSAPEPAKPESGDKPATPSPAEVPEPDQPPPENPPQPVAAAASANGAAQATSPGTWREHLERAIEALEAELQSAAPPEAAPTANAATPQAALIPSAQPEPQRRRARQEAYLRLLYLAAQRHADAARGIEAFAPAEREFWKHQLHGLGVFLDEQGAPIPDRRARLALRELQEGMHHLAAATGLDVRNLAFCPQVFSYGNYVEFTPYEFRPNQEVLLYAEIDHFTVEPRPDGFETELQGSYQIFDAAGRRVAEHVFPPEKELCRNRRRDYFIPFRMYLPKRIAPGPYTLQLTVEDLKGRKFGQASIRFTIAP